MKNTSRYFSIGILLLILLVGLGLRLFQIGELSLGNDDLSTLTRLQYDTFAELIEHGVKEDVHPAGVQVFMWGWTKAFGQEEWVLHLPFLVMGLLLVWLTYLLGTRLISETGALLAAAMMAATEYGIFHSLTIRPYTVGACVLVALALIVTKLVKQEATPHWAQLLQLAVLGALSAYVHYFAALVAVVLVSSGLLLIRREDKLRYGVAIVVMALLYAPHLGIFFHHGGQGGSAWMGSPDKHFFLRYGGYLFHFSWLFAIGTAGIVGGLVLKTGLARTYSRSRWVLLDWVILPVAVGVLYSWLVAPIVHAGVLFFCFPFFAILLFSMSSQTSQIITASAVVLLMGLCVVSLVWERDFYGWFYGRGAKEMVRLYVEGGNADKAGWMQVYHPYYIDYYLAKTDPVRPLEGYELPPLEQVLAWADTTSAEVVALGWLGRYFPLQYLTALERSFPIRSKERLWAISEYYELSKAGSSNEVAPWRALSKINGMRWTPEEVYIGTQEIIPHDYFSDFPEILSVELDARIDSIGEGLPQLVLSIEVNGESRFWRSSDLIARSDGSYLADLVFRTRELPVLQNPGAVLKAYLWNAGRSGGEILRLEVRRRPGNPRLYAFVEEVKH